MPLSEGNAYFFRRARKIIIGLATK